MLRPLLTSSPDSPEEAVCPLGPVGGWQRGLGKGVQFRLTITRDTGWNSPAALLTVVKADHSKASGV